MNPEIHEACKECRRKCAQFVCCLCEHKDVCECSKIEPPEENEYDDDDWE